MSSMACLNSARESRAPVTAGSVWITRQKIKSDDPPTPGYGAIKTDDEQALESGGDGEISSLSRELVLLVELYRSGNLTAVAPPHLFNKHEILLSTQSSSSTHDLNPPNGIFFGQA